MENMVLFTEQGRALIASLGGEIDHHTARSVREVIDKELFKYKPERLILDFSALKFMDSSGIALIIGRSEVCSGIGAALVLSGLSEMQKKLIRLSGVEKIKNISILSE